MIKDLYKVNRGSEFELYGEDDFTDPNVNPVMDITKRAEYKYHYRPEEAAVYHPIEKSAMKMRNNGSVDIFTQDETGSRFDKEHQVSNDFANDKKVHIFNFTEWLTGDSKSFVKGHRTMKTKGKTYIQSGQDITVDADSNLIVNVKKNQTVIIQGNADVKINGNVDAKVNGHAKIDVDKDINMRGHRNISMVADGYVHIDGRALYIGQDVLE